MIEIRLEQFSYKPGEVIRGMLYWDGLNESTELDVRLVWCTQGKGTRAFEVVRSQKVSVSKSAGSAAIQMTTPEWPHSFSGKLLSLFWVLEAVGPAGLASSPASLIIGPNASEIQLPRDEERPKQKTSIRDMMTPQ